MVRQPIGDLRRGQWQDARILAADFLMPAEAVRDLVQDSGGTGPEGLNAKHVVAIQQYFKVSYAAALIRLKALSLIIQQALERAKSYDGYPTLAALTQRCGYPTSLSQADELVQVPASSLRKVAELHERDKIPFGSRKYFTPVDRNVPGGVGIRAEPDRRRS